MFHLTCDEFFKSSDATVCSEIRAPQQDYPEHTHDFHELIIVTKGAGQHILNDIPTNLAQNYICYISPKDRHLYEQADNLHLTNILFKKNRMTYSPLLKQVLPTEQEDPCSWYISTDSMKRVDSILAQIEQESGIQSMESYLMTEALFQQLVIELSRGRLSAASGHDVDNCMLRIIDWIQTHYAEELCSSTIAGQFDVSSRTLSRRIKQMTNLSFNNYVHRVRINNAMNLLLYSDLSITDIAFQVGYKDSNYFSTKFKRFTSKSPSEYR